MEEELRCLAERQHGVVATWQSDGDARGARRTASGQWELQGAVLRRRGSPRTPEQLVMSGVLDAGPGAVASHDTAAALWGLPGFPLEPVEVTCGGRRSSHHPASVTRHRPVLLLDHHRTATSGVPVTTLARTLFDLAGRLREDRLARLVNLVANRSPGTLVALHQLLDELACRGRAGIQAMRSVLADRPLGSTLAASGLELRFEQVLRESGQPPLRRQVDLGRHEWKGRVDDDDDETRAGRRGRQRAAPHEPDDRASDEARDRSLPACGVRRVLRVPEEHLWYRPDLAVDAVRRARRELARTTRA